MSSVLSHAGPLIAALMIAAANRSPWRMSWGSSSDWCPKFGSTTENDGNVPAAASVRNCVVLEMFALSFLTIDGMIATDGRSV